MHSYRQSLFIFYFLHLLSEIFPLDNGLARTPPMGWMSWGYYMCAIDCIKNPDKCLDEKLVMSVAKTFAEEGYQEAGYEYVIVDDCWSERWRNVKNQLVPDRFRFPRGMKFLGDYIHSKGLKFGMYTNIANVTCMGFPGSRGYFRKDTSFFAQWGVDYLKVDGCFVTEDWLNVAYIQLGEQLKQSGRNMVYSCSWPYYIEFIHKKKPNLTAIVPHCNLWRNYHDVVTEWEAIRLIIQWYERHYDEYAPYHGPGHWNDPDMLIFGTRKLKDSQSRVQLAVYAMLSAPLLLSCDMKQITAYEKHLLLNMEIIAINQDPLGEMAKPYKFGDSFTVWVKRHLPMKADKYHSYSFAFVNLDDKKHNTFYVSPAQYDLTSPDGYTVMDVFSKTYFKNVTLNDILMVKVPPEDVIWYSLFPL